MEKLVETYTLPFNSCHKQEALVTSLFEQPSAKETEQSCLAKRRRIKCACKICTDRECSGTRDWESREAGLFQRNLSGDKQLTICLYGGRSPFNAKFSRLHCMADWTKYISILAIGMGVAFLQNGMVCLYPLK